jgi:hypothetical protein
MSPETPELPFRALTWGLAFSPSIAYSAGSAKNGTTGLGGYLRPRSERKIRIVGASDGH